ncbi:MFS transporter [Trinickia diaoshuihuensis]|uniref:MFS transporter n=1 Tax=Trinickia diaoshuihuensis TaxID=2292265 RepID=UPI0013C374F5|nr:MFS transporter [Trinickia diaoshuihuensis]
MHSLISTWEWRALFLAIAAASLSILAVVFNNIEESRNPEARGVDLAGTVNFTAALAVIFVSIVQGPHFGWGSGMTIGLIAAGCLLLLLFVVVESRIRAPMLDLSLFGNARFLGVLLLPVVTGFSFIALLVYPPIWFIGVEGDDEFHAGLAILPLTAPMLIVPFLAGILSKRFSAASLCSTALAFAAVGVFGLSRVTAASAFVDVALPMLAIGIGNGVPWGLMDSLAMNAIPKERAGMAAGIFSTMRVTGEAIAIAIIGAALGCSG